MEQTDPDIEREEYLGIYDNMGQHCKEGEQEENQDRGKVNALGSE